jgi:biotin synthase
LEICEEEGVLTRSMMLIGLGESNKDRISHLFYLKGLKQLYHLRFSRFFPFPSTEYRNHPRCSPWEVARIVAVARLILPDVQLGLASGNSLDDMPLWFLAGGGNQLIGASANLKGVPNQPEVERYPITDNLSIVSRMKIQERYAQEMGLSIGFACPPLKRSVPAV